MNGYQSSTRGSGPPDELYVIGLKLIVNGYDGNTLYLCLGDYQTVEPISVMVWQAGHMKRMEMFDRQRKDGIPGKPFWDKVFGRFRQFDLAN